MIIPNQKNIKVHFAGIENIPQFVSAYSVGTKYFLWSVFPFIAEQFEIQSIKIFANKTEYEIPQLIHANGRHTIMDSGLFTLMFGSHKGNKDLRFLKKWQEAMTDFVLASEYKGVCVEVDCQKVLNPAAAWKLRVKLRTDLPGNRIINVFHKEDGQKGLDRLIEFSDYIAISIPELRILGKKIHAIKLCEYIKNKKPEIDIHLLGCTEMSLLKRLNFCTTSDSTSWKAAFRYGSVRTLLGKFHISKLKGSKPLEDYTVRVVAAANKLGVNLSLNHQLAEWAFACDHERLRYSATLGPQG